MSTKHTGLGIDRDNYDSATNAFSNYMNILADFINRVNSLYPEDLDNEELNSLLTTIKNQGDEIDTLRKKIDLLELSKVNKEKAVTKTTKEKKTKKVAKKE